MLKNIYIYRNTESNIVPAVFMLKPIMQAAITVFCLACNLHLFAGQNLRKSPGVKFHFVWKNKVFFCPQ
jgi:hypothetical protein